MFHICYTLFNLNKMKIQKRINIFLISKIQFLLLLPSDRNTSSCNAYNLFNYYLL